MAKSWQELVDILSSKLISDQSSDYFSSSEKLMAYICTENYYRNKLLEWIKSKLCDDSYKKSSSKSVLFRTEGNEHFKRKRYSDSLRLYWDSVRYAEAGSEELALAHSNRSAALFHLDHFQECLNEIDRALDSKLPCHLWHKLYLRQGDCYTRLRQFKKAVKSYELARDSLDRVSSLSKAKQAAIEEEIEKALNNARTKQVSENNCDDSVEEIRTCGLPKPTYGESDVLAYASAALNLRYSEEKGRHVVTDRDIKAGDTLFVEKPYALVVLQDKHDAHCHHCCKSVVALVPCEDCADGVYCSAACRKESWRGHHCWECRGGLRMLQSLGIAHLALRVLLQVGGSRELLDKQRELAACPPPAGQAALCRGKDDGYAAVYNLLPHLEHMDREDYAQYALTAALLTLYLTNHTVYLEECDDLSSALEVVGSLLHRHVAQLVCNGHAITELRLDDDDDDAGKVVSEHQVRVGTAIYPSASMLNHSCDPNIINSFYNQYLIIRACRDIPKGHEVFNCYGPHYRRTNVQERQALLKGQYFFTCTCEHCRTTSRFDLQDRFNGMLCSRCEGPLLDNLRHNNVATHSMMCVDCGNVQGYSDLVELAFQAHHAYKTACELLDTSSMKEALNKFVECWQLRRNCLYRNNSSLTVCQDNIAKCYAMLGNYEESARFLEMCLPAVEEQFGADSIELSNELQKLTDVMICHLQQLHPAGPPSTLQKVCIRTAEFLHRAKEIMELHYGSWSNGLRDITAKEKQLEEMKYCPQM